MRTSALSIERGSHDSPPWPPGPLLLFFACFLAAPLARQGFFDAPFLAGFQVKGVTLDFLDDVFLLYLSLEATQGVLERLASCSLTSGTKKLHPQTGPVWTRQLLQDTSSKSSINVEYRQPMPLLATVCASNEHGFRELVLVRAW